jgi:hypothetical protein
MTGSLFSLVLVLLLVLVVLVVRIDVSQIKAFLVNLTPPSTSNHNTESFSAKTETLSAKAEKFSAKTEICFVNFSEF